MDTGIAIAEPMPVDGWKAIPIVENGSPLVPLGPFSRYGDIFTDAIYYGERADSPYRGAEALSGALITMFVCQEVADRLRAAQALLAAGLRLVVLDTYRPLPVQQALYERYQAILRRRQPDWDEVRLAFEAQRFVSLPSTDPSRPSPHNTGGSVDLAILQLDGRDADDLRRVEAEMTGEPEGERRYELEMQRIDLLRRACMLDFGTRFDHWGEASALTYLEHLAAQRVLTSGELEARSNRRLLDRVMRAVGMLPYADEWWHWNAPETQMGAQVAGLKMATYGAATLTDVELAHEEMRRRYHTDVRSVRLRAGIDDRG